ncbi:MAG: lysine--tRNA ligase [Anaerolineae bacterium]|nr:lysine--tRNA ligase [Anaerolineae bacterium]
MTRELSEHERQRRLKLERLRQAGIDPYPPRCRRTHTNQQAIAAFEAGQLGEDQEISIVGRLVSIRVMGRSTFAHVEDGTGRLQVYLRQDEVGEEAYTLFKQNFDLGDFMEATGPLFRTRTGEVTVRARQFRMLAKAIRPLPVVKEKDGVVYDAFTDKEARYRERYVDLNVNPHVREIFRKRARIIQAIREFLDARGFLEVETPILQPVYGGAAARPFVTHHNQLHQDLYLRISFELYLKRLIVGGYEKVYEIGRDFRNEGVSFKHNPEFTQLEFYEAYADYHDVMETTEQMLAYVAQQVLGTLQFTYQGHTIDLTPPWRRIKLRDAIREATGIDYEAHPTAASLLKAIRAIGGRAEAKDNRGKLIDYLIGAYVEPNLIQPTFLMDYPVEMSPLAKKKPDDPNTVERFEGFVGGMEICNAFTELNDPLDQEERFLEQGRAYEAGDEEAHQMDEDYLNALSYGMPPTGGFGMGIDRLTMLLTDQSSIREVILFPHLRPRERE